MVGAGTARISLTARIDNPAPISGSPSGPPPETWFMCRPPVALRDDRHSSHRLWVSYADNVTARIS
jgi:hypothetical protein